MKYFDPWSINPPILEPAAVESKCCNSVQDPLKSFLEEKEKDIGNGAKLEKLFGEAWSEVPEKMLSELSIAIEKDELDSTEAQEMSPSNPKPIKVLIHWVRHADTIPGISLKYGINTEFLRRFNRLWPNDRRPLRPFLFIPLSLAPKLKTLSQEYPDLFYEVQATSLAKVSSALTFQEEVSPGSSTYSGDLIEECSYHSTSLTPDALSDTSPRPVLVIPNCQLKYFPPSGTKESLFNNDLPHKCKFQDEASQYKTLEPLFHKSHFGFFRGQDLPDETETRLPTQEKWFPGPGLEGVYPKGKVNTTPAFRTWDSRLSSNYSESASQFFKLSPISKSTCMYKR